MTEGNSTFFYYLNLPVAGREKISCVIHLFFFKIIFKIIARSNISIYIYE